MTHLAITDSTGNAMFHTPLDNTTPVVQVDIGRLLDLASTSSASITQIVENYTQTMSRVVDADTRILFNSMADSALYSHQVNLQSLQQQMDTYAGAMRGNPHFFQIKASVAEAILLAEVYRSQTNTIHATIAHPAATISHNTGAQHAQSEINTLNAPTRATTPVQVNVDTNATLTTFSLGETADDAIEMQVDNETVLQLGLRPDEINQFDRLLDEPLEDPLD